MTEKREKEEKERKREKEKKEKRRKRRMKKKKYLKQLQLRNVRYCKLDHTLWRIVHQAGMVHLCLLRWCPDYIQTAHYFRGQPVSRYHYQHSHYPKNTARALQVIDRKHHYD